MDKYNFYFFLLELISNFFFSSRITKFDGMKRIISNIL